MAGVKLISERPYNRLEHPFFYCVNRSLEEIYVVVQIRSNCRFVVFKCHKKLFLLLPSPFIVAPI